MEFRSSSERIISEEEELQNWIGKRLRETGERER